MNQSFSQGTVAIHPLLLVVGHRAHQYDSDIFSREHINKVVQIEPRLKYSCLLIFPIQK